jgi:hypothetical protein
MEDVQLRILHDHYRDTCALLKGYRATRDWCFYFVILVVAAAWFDVVAPDDFAHATADALRARFQLTNVPNLTYLRGVLWFTLLGLALRYCQASLNVEREYKYLHRIEALLAEQVHPAFGREGAHYAANSLPFTGWAHAIYTSVFPVLLVVIVFAWTLAQSRAWPAWPWSGSAWFEVGVSAAIVATVAIYVWSHRQLNAKRT